jgi:phytoene dehydrogenase-like protein
VASVIEDNGMAVGVRLADGRQVSADHVVSAGDLRSTLYDLLGGNHLDPQHQKLFASVQTLSPIVQVSFGLKTPLSITADSVLGETHQLKKQIKVGNQVFDRIMLKSSGYDSTLAPDGKVVVKCPFVMRDYSYWENLAPDRNAYAAEKSRIASTVADALEDFYPGFKAAIEMTDVATPMTYVRYTANWKGTFMTWIIPPDKANEFRTIKKTVPGLNNFWLCGMWVQAPGGTPGAAISARQVVQLICHKDRRRFRTSVPAEGRAAAA